MKELTSYSCGHLEVTRIFGTPENRKNQRNFALKVSCSLCYRTAADKFTISILHSCGHVEKHDPPTKDPNLSRDEQLKQWEKGMSSKLCYVCLSDLNEKRFYGILEEHGAILPPLKGTFNEIEWARAVQKDVFIEYFDEGNSVQFILKMFSWVRSAKRWFKLNRYGMKVYLDELLFKEMYGTFPQLPI